MFNKGYFPLIVYRKKRKSRLSSKEIGKNLNITKTRRVVERTFAWMKRKCRRLIMRWETRAELRNAFAMLEVIYGWKI